MEIEIDVSSTVSVVVYKADKGFPDVVGPIKLERSCAPHLRCVESKYSKYSLKVEEV